MTSHFDKIKPGGVLVYPFTAQLSNDLKEKKRAGEQYPRRIRAEKRVVTSDKESASQTNSLVLER